MRSVDKDRNRPRAALRFDAVKLIHGRTMSPCQASQQRLPKRWRKIPLMLQAFDEPGCDRLFYVVVTVFKKSFYELEKRC